jgi:hypothetical protein
LDSAISGHWIYHAEKAFIRALPEHALAGSTTTQEKPQDDRTVPTRRD